MLLEFYGGAGCVTGSCHILKVNNTNILLDCGMFQGKDGYKGENFNFPFEPRKIDYVILSHGHIDHSGRIPYLHKMGFKGKVVATNATKELCEVMLKDSGNIQEMECEHKNKYRREKGEEELEPLYTLKDAENSMKLFDGYDYNKEIQLNESIKIKFRDAGHLLGSAITELFINDNGEEKKIVYSGDLGNKSRPIIKDPSTVYNGDYVIMESTYGDENHKEGNYFVELIEIIKETINKKGNVIIPCFSIGRTQEILYILNGYVEKGEIKCKVFVDSPLAKEATEVFKNNEFVFDEEAKKLLNLGDDPLDFKNLSFTKDVEDSKCINSHKDSCIIISSSGMCDAGRIKYHILNNIEDEKNSIIFVGYQCNGTLGRKILNKDKEVKILGKIKSVNAKVYNINGLSGHADKKGILSWIDGFEGNPKKIILVHGEDKVREKLAQTLENKGYNVIKPFPGDKITL